MMVKLPDAALSGDVANMGKENQHTANDSQEACDGTNEIGGRKCHACLGLGEHGVNMDADEGKSSSADTQRKESRDDSRDEVVGPQGFSSSVASGLARLDVEDRGSLQVWLGVCT